MPLCYGATVGETEQEQDDNDIEDCLTFSIKGLEGFAILDGEATKTVSGFMSVQPVADQYEDTTIETTDRQARKSGLPNAEFPQGISVNVV